MCVCVCVCVTLQHHLCPGVCWCPWVILVQRDKFGPEDSGTQVELGNKLCLGVLLPALVTFWDNSVPKTSVIHHRSIPSRSHSDPAFHKQQFKSQGAPCPRDVWLLCCSEWGLCGLMSLEAEHSFSITERCFGICRDEENVPITGPRGLMVS